MFKNRTWVIVLAIIFALSCVGCIWMFFRTTSGTVANIYQDGVCIRSIDLDQVTQPYQFTVSDENGENTILVEPGRICIAEADCPDQVCVASGWLSDSTVPIVCLPHRLVIQIEDKSAGTNDIDSVVQ